MAHPQIKFCGLRRLEDVETAVRLGADFVGFVFAESSPRGLDLETARRVLAEADTGAARRVGVFQDQAFEFVQRAVTNGRLDLVQLHGNESKEFSEALDVPVIPVLRPPVAGVRAERNTSGLPRNTFAVLIDAQDASGRSGGLGLQVDASEYDALRGTLPAGVRVFLAGGLTPENVASRVAHHNPDVVDVSSGVESAVGIKDPVRMRAFVEALRGPA